MKRTLSTLALISLLSGCMPPLQTSTPHGLLVGKDGASLLKEPGPFAATIKKLSPGETVMSIGSQGMYYYAIAGADTGFVSRSSAMDVRSVAALNYPTVFRVPKLSSDEAWGRATQFVAENSSMKLQTATDLLLETYSPLEIGDYGYQIMRSPVGDSVQYTVRGYSFHGNPFSNQTEEADHNAHAAAYFIATGNLIPELISR